MPSTNQHNMHIQFNRPRFVTYLTACLIFIVWLIGIYFIFNKNNHDQQLLLKESIFHTKNQIDGMFQHISNQALQLPITKLANNTCNASFQKKLNTADLFH